LTKGGKRPQRIILKLRSPALSQITGTSWVGATLYLAGKFGVSR